MAARATKGDGVRLEVNAELLHVEADEQIPNLVAYAFSSGGQLLDSTPIEKGNATLFLDKSDNPRGVRVLVGPQADEGEFTIAELRRIGAAERRLRLEANDLNPKVQLEIAPDSWRLWLLRRCCVPGTLLKRIVTGGIPIDLPVCHATIEVYEVDPIHIILPRIPDLELDRWRDIIIQPGRPIPPLPPGPQPDPPPFEREELIRELRSIEMPAPLKLAARAASLDNFRLELLRNPRIVWPLLCLFYPRFVRMTKICETTTDECGKFRCCFWRSIFNPDTPDLYFKAYRQLGPFRIPIYAPTPVGCHTRWNYQCGTEVVLYTTSPWARTCAPCPPVEAPDNWVLVMAIGNLSLANIRGASLGLAPTTDSANKGLTGGGAPFGGLLRPRIEFDNSLRDVLGIKYYRVQWRKVGGTFQSLDRAVNRHYAHEVGGDVVIDQYALGPVTVGGTPNLFEIPPAMPPSGQWSFPNVVEDTASAYFPTADFAPPAEAGKYELKIDLFDAAGNPVDIGALGIKFRVPSVEDLSGTITTEDAAHPSLNLVSGNSFVMTLHVDNSPCAASIAAPTIAGTPASDECGVLEYTPASLEMVVMNYEASHPSGFATFAFELYRGVNKLTPPSTSGPVGGGAHVASGTAADLLGGCSVAGFAEHLHVYAMATNGWSRQSQLDAHDVRAFVLAPKA